MSDIGHFFRQNENAFFSLIFPPYKHSNSLFCLFQPQGARALGDLAARMFLNLFVSRTKLAAGGIVATVAFTFVVALITISYQVIKTARAVPVDSLRYE
jgi:hypothetical protein